MINLELFIQASNGLVFGMDLLSTIVPGTTLILILLLSTQLFGATMVPQSFSVFGPALLAFSGICRCVYDHLNFTHQQSYYYYVIGAFLQSCFQFQVLVLIWLLVQYIQIEILMSAQRVFSSQSISNRFSEDEKRTYIRRRL